MCTLVDGFLAAGHQVEVATNTRSNPGQALSYPVHRGISSWKLYRLARESDVCLSASVALKSFLPLWCSGRPLVIAHHAWYRGHHPLPLALAKEGAAFLARNIFVSDVVDARIWARGSVIKNAYDEGTFRRLSNVERNRELLYVGRLVTEKGIDILLAALRLLAQRGEFPRLTIVGGGPARESLETLVHDLALDSQVRFVGPLTGARLNRVMNQHKVLVIPSRVEESFGLVALEGIAAGCFVVGADAGGLPEAIGPCGSLARRGDPGDLADKISAACGDPRLLERAQEAASRHLARHKRDVLIVSYLEFLKNAAGSPDRGQVLKDAS